MARLNLPRQPAGLHSEARVAGRQVNPHILLMYSVIGYPASPVFGPHLPQYDIVLTANLKVPHEQSGELPVPLFPPFALRSDAEAALTNVYLSPYDPVNPWLEPKSDFDNDVSL